MNSEDAAPPPSAPGGWFAYEAPDLTDEQLLAAAEAEDVSLRFRAAGHRRMPLEGLRRLATDPEPVIRSTVAAHESATAELLAEMALRHPEDASFIARHPEAPLPLMESIPLTEHTQYGLRGYLRRRGALHRWPELLQLVDDAVVASDTVTLGEAVKRLLGA